MLRGSMKYLVAAIFSILGLCAYWNYSNAPEAKLVGTSENGSICPLWVNDRSAILNVDLGIDNSIGRTDVTLRIPESYVLPRSLERHRSGKLDGAALIFARLPDFGPQPVISIDPKSEDAAQNVAVLVTTFVDMDKILTSEIEVWGRPQEGETFPEVKIHGGLFKVDYPNFGEPGFEAFFARVSDTVTDVIMCDNRTDGRAACTHKFDAGNVEVELSYARSNFDDWATIKNSAQALVHCVAPQN